MSKQRHTLVFIKSWPLRILSSKGLTWRTPAEQHGIGSFRLNPVLDRFNVDLTDVSKLEVRIGEVSLEARPSIRIVIQSKRNIHASGLKATACAATSGEKIVHLNSQQLIQRESRFARGGWSPQSQQDTDPSPQ